ncbi:hypothetical protein WDV85_00440 [Pseudokineococcus sp. 5B2Z-1]|uniref:hypothetical protein n=1 Tax=Pseudokineococcus sp. 5B2Z-1 TaxID=3132744 RepID=UPI00309B0502
MNDTSTRGSALRRLVTTSVLCVGAVAGALPAAAAPAPVTPARDAEPSGGHRASDGHDHEPSFDGRVVAGPGATGWSGPATAPDAAGRLRTAGTVPTPRPVQRYTGEPEGFAPYVPQVACDPVERAGTLRLRDLIHTTYGGTRGGTTRSCAGRSEHSDGRAYDWMLDARDPADAAQADAFLTWLIGPDAQGRPSGNARRLGIMYVIWDRKIWGSYNRTWKVYSGASPHTDHIHISLSWDGAMARTSFWTGTTLTGTDYGPCVPYTGEAAPAYSGSRNPSPCPTPGPRPVPAAPTPVPAGAQTVAGDWDGDGADEVGLYVDGAVSLRQDDGSTLRYRYGQAGDVAVVGDWDGDGRETVGVYRRGRWLLKDDLSGGSADRAFWMGGADDVPVVGSWDGRRLGVGIYRQGRWMLRTSVGAGPVDVSVDFGRPTDRPVPGDWDGDGADTPGLQRGAQRFRLDSLWPASPSPTFFGRAGMQGFAGDLDGDARDGWGVRSGATVLWRHDTNGGAAQGSVVLTP